MVIHAFTMFVKGVNQRCQINMVKLQIILGLFSEHCAKKKD